MQFLSVCSGIEAASVAWEPLGWRAAGLSEIEPFPCHVLAHRQQASRPMFMPDPAKAANLKDERARKAALKAVHRLPDPSPDLVPNFGDLTRFKEWPDAVVDLLVGGTPCFPAGTMVALDRGFVPIEEVRVGDLALTHKGRFRRVLRAGSKNAPTVVIKGQGHFGMVTTANHPFYARRRTSQSTRRGGKSVRLSDVSLPDWLRADALPGHHWACVSRWPAAAMRRPFAIGREKPVGLSDEALMLLAGAYLGDGWGRQDARRGFVYFGINAAKLAALRPVLDDLSAYNVQGDGAACRVQISSRPLARWLMDEFGSGAGEKSVPMWALGLPLDLRQALVRGYQITDGGHTETSGIRATTVSRQLALTMRALSVSCGYASSVGHAARPRTAEIDGRVISQRDTYTVTFSHSGRTSFEDGGFRWQRVRSVEPTGRVERVYDLEVEEDHSYVADGICVHNCQSFSVAGLRKGLDDPRGNLALTYLAVADRYRPRWVVWENVPGVLSSNKGRDFGAFLGGLGQLGYGWAYRVLDAQFIRTRGLPRAVPQRRRRVFVVGYLGDWRRAAAVLFDSQSMRGDPPPRREARQGSAGTISTRTRGGGGFGTDFEVDGGLIPEISNAIAARDAKQPRAEDNVGIIPVAHSLRAEGFDASEDGTGRGTPLVPLAFSAKDYGADASEGVSPTLRARGHGESHANAGVMPAIAIQERAVSENPDAGPDGVGVRSDGAAYTLEARTTAQAIAFDAIAGGDTALAAGNVPGALHGHSGRAAVAFDLRGREGGAVPEGPHDTANIRAASGGSSRSYLAMPWAVRRLTPLECERLQGFPDGYTQVPYRGRPAADGPRYKALGNSMAVNAMEWIGARIAFVEGILGDGP